jgi:hypothetical protein
MKRNLTAYSEADIGVMIEIWKTVLNLGSRENVPRSIFEE